MKHPRLLLVIVGSMLLAGCADAEAELETGLRTVFVDQSGVKETADYQNYKKIKETNEEKFDDNEYYVGKEGGGGETPEEPSVPEDSVHLTFAQNEYFDIKYFSDAACTVPLDAGGGYLTPGETLYAVVTPYTSDGGQNYVFDGFRIVSFDASSHKQLETLPLGADHAVFTVTDDLVGSTLSVLPISQYTPAASGAFTFDPSAYTDQYQHGTVKFSHNGKELTQTEEIPVGDKIDYEQVNADDGYYLQGGSITVANSNDETYNRLKSIHFDPIHTVTVNLPQPDCGGQIRYTLEEEELTGESVSAATDDAIRMEFIAWEGWESCIKNDSTDAVYSVSDDTQQTVVFRANGSVVGVDDIFTEHANHKPVLTVSLDKKLEKTQVKLSAPGLEETVYSYDGKLGQNDTVIKEQPIGTQSGIELELTGCELLPDEAVKLEWTIETEEGKETTYQRFEQDLSRALEPIELYTPDEIADSPNYYKSISLTISIAEVEAFETPTAAHAAVQVQNVKTGEPLAQGALVDLSDKVDITVSPDSGYYLNGPSLTDGFFKKDEVYEERLTFSKYREKIDDIIQEHPAQKYCEITLADCDDYGNCPYELEGKEVTGKIQAKSGQKLTLDYEVTEPGYIIEKNSKLPFGIGKNDKKESGSLTVDLSLDGQTVSRESFGIQVGKEGA